MPLLNLPATALLLANIVPLFGVMFLQWDVFDVMFLFWAENVIIGLLNILRMLVLLFKKRAIEAIFMIPFFTVHYGGFCAGHGFFIVALFLRDPFTNEGIDLDWTVIAEIITHTGIIIGIAALLASHLLSFLINFLGKQEYNRTNMGKLMATPYARIVLLHVTIIFGGMLVMATGAKIWALIFLVILKIIVDLVMHRREHKKLEQSA